MQLKGLVRFFTILLIIYSLYQLSFTWFVRNHEKKLEAKALTDLHKTYPQSVQFKTIEQLPDSLKKYYDGVLRHYEDSTKNKTLTYGINGKVSYKRAKAEELNLGLDLQGGMSVTLEVEMAGLIKNLAKDSKDPAFRRALQNAELQKANSSADFITLFANEYVKSNPTVSLAALFAGGSANAINPRDEDGKVLTYLRNQADEGFETTFNTLSKRIDQFGVAQPNITKNIEKKTITVELPGVKDKERVKAKLQTSANPEFWELYTVQDRPYAEAWNKFLTAYDAKYAGLDTAAKTPADTANKADTSKTAGKGDTILKKDTGLTLTKLDSGSKTAKQNKPNADKSILKFFGFTGFQPSHQSEKHPNVYVYYGAIGYVAEKDTMQMNKALREFGYLFPGDAAFVYGIPDKKNPDKYPLYALKTNYRTSAEIDGSYVTNSSARFDEYNRAEIILTMNNKGDDLWAAMTGRNVDRPVAIVLDSIVQSAPNVIGKIEGGNTSITGSYTIDEAKELAKILNIGRLKAPVKIVAETEVGPTLGKKAIEGGLKAFLISFIVIFLLMLVYYNTSGWVANIALILNLLFTIGVLSGLGASLTAPGIAGLVLTIGMAVDTNVIIYERIKEELSKGKGYIPAINEGYKRSLPPVLDAHVTTLLTAIILFSFGTGSIQGFATTQILGILLSLFCGILVSRWISDWFTNKKKHLEYFTGISRSIFKHAKFKFIEYRKIAYVISFVVLGLGIASFFNGFDEGVEFKGGRSYRIKFDNAITNIDQLRDELKSSLGNQTPIVKTAGSNAVLDITTSYMIDSTSKNADSLVLQSMMTGLKNHLPAGITYEQFSTQRKLSADKVTPTISSTLKRGAIRSTIIAILIIFLYILLRFRDWRYSLGTIVALLHDVFVTLIVFSFARSIVPFPMEIDQHFIAAVLTVIGFSMNDTVIVFDRIREDSRLMPNAPKAEVINRAINETLSRTVMTSLTVFLTILILFIFGGEVTRGFAFAMLVGVITGTYSSIFVAAPILVDLGGKKALGKSNPDQKKS